MDELNTNEIRNIFLQISEYLESIKTQNALNISDTSRALGNITLKLDSVNNNENAEILKTLITEIKKDLDNRYNIINTKFSDVENVFKSLSKRSEDLITAPEIRELFDILSTNISVFAKQTTAQENILNEITLRIEGLRTDDTQKQDIIKNISAVKTDIDKFNNGFESIIININENFKNIMERLKEQENSDTEEIKKGLDSVLMSSNTILSTIKIFDIKNKQLEDIINSLATSKDFEDSKELMNEIIAQNNKLNASVRALAGQSDFDGLNEKVASAVQIVEDLKNKIGERNEEGHNLLIEALNNLKIAAENILTDDDFHKFTLEFSKQVNEVIQSTNILRGDVLGTTAEIKNLIASLNELDIKNSFTDFNNKVDITEGNLKANFYELSSNVLQENKRNINSLAETIENKINDLTNNVNDIPRATTETLNIGIMDISGKLNANNSIHDQKFSQIFEKLSELTLTTEQISSSGINSMKFNIEELTKQLEEAKKDISKESKQSYSELVEKLKGITQSLSMVEQKMQLNAFDVVMEALSQLTQKVEASNVLRSVPNPEIVKSLDAIKELVNFIPNIINENQKELIGNLSVQQPITSTVEEKLAGTDIYSNTLIGKVDELEKIIAKIAGDYDMSLYATKTELIEKLSEIYVKLNGDASDSPIQLQTSIEQLDYHLQAMLNLMEHQNQTQVFQEETPKVINTASQENFSSGELVNFDFKLNKLKEQLNFAVTDLIENLNNRSSEILTAIDPNYEKNEDTNAQIEAYLEDLKTQIQEYRDSLEDFISNVYNDDKQSKLENLFAGMASLNYKIDSLENEITNKQNTQLEEIKALLNGKTSSIIQNQDIANSIDNIIKEENNEEHFKTPMCIDLCAITSSLEEISNNIKNLQLLQTPVTNDGQSVVINSESNEEIKLALEKLNQKIDIIAMDDNSRTNLNDTIEDLYKILENVEILKALNSTNEINMLKGIEQLSMLNDVINVEKLNALNKLNLLDKLGSLERFNDIENIPKLNGMIETQEQLRALVSELEVKINQFLHNCDTFSFKEEFNEIKSELIKQVLIVLDQISFVEESEGIKDFVQEKTNNIIEIENRNKEELYTKLENIDKEVKLVKQTFNTYDFLEYSDLEDDFANIKESLDNLTNCNISDNFNTVKESLDNLTNCNISDNFNKIHSDLNKLTSYDINYNINVVNESLEELSETNNKINNKISEFTEKVNENTENINNSLEEITKSIQIIDEYKDELSYINAKVDELYNNNIKEDVEKSDVEEIKNEINKFALLVNEQLNYLKTGTNESNDYIYSMQDVESDIAKLRLTLNEIQQSTNINDVSKKIAEMAKSVESLKFSFSQDDLFKLRVDFDKLNMEIVSISSRMNKMMLSTDNLKGSIDSILNELKTTLKSMPQHKMDGIETKLEDINSTLQKNIESDKNLTNAVANLTGVVSSTGSDSIAQNIEDLKRMMPSSGSILATIELKFEKQQKKIDILEDKIDELIEVMESRDSSQMNKKMNSIEKQLSRLSRNIEKLTSYVDDEDDD